MLGRSALKLFPFPCLRGSLALRRRAPGGLSVTSSLGPVIGSAAAVVSGGSHAAVTSTLAHVAVTAVAIASGACLSTKVDFLWPRAEQMPGKGFLDSYL